MVANKKSYSPFIFIFLSVISFNLSAAIVKGFNIQTLSQQAQVVFEGEVIHRETSVSPYGNQVFTYVTFKISDVIKGNYPYSTIKLGFIGGVYNRMMVKVPGVRIPAMGEHGLYFVRDLSRPSLHPLIGWNQGHYIIKSDKEGTYYVYTNTGKLIYQFDAPNSTSKAMSRGYARGLSVHKSVNNQKPITLNGFKQKIKVFSGQK